MMLTATHLYKARSQELHLKFHQIHCHNCHIKFTLKLYLHQICTWMRSILQLWHPVTSCLLPTLLFSDMISLSHTCSPLRTLSVNGVQWGFSQQLFWAGRTRIRRSLDSATQSSRPWTRSVSGVQWSSGRGRTLCFCMMIGWNVL